MGQGLGPDPPLLGMEVTDSVSGERCEGRVLGGTAGPPVGFAQTWAPRAEEEPAPVRQTGDTGEGKLISTSDESGGGPSVDIQLSQEFNYPRPRGRRVQYLVDLCVCVCVCVCLSVCYHKIAV